MLKENKAYLDSAVDYLDIPIDKKGLNKVPLAWTKVFYKKYPRFKSIPLAINFNQKTPLNILNLKRESNRKMSNKKIPFKKFSNILFWSFGEKLKLRKSSFPRRMYPSGGGRYPIELYVVALNVGNLERGIYHYNVRDNNLELIQEGTKEFQKTLYGKFKKASFFVIMSNCFSRNEVKYGTKALMLSLMDAGHMGQNFLLKCTENNVGSCAIFGFKRDRVSQILDLDDEEEVPVYCLAAGLTAYS